MNTTATASTATDEVTAEQAAELYAAINDPTTKWAFLDGVVTMCDQHPILSQREVVDMIGDAPTFIALHGHHRDSGDAGKKASSRLKSIRDELSVVKVWAPADRVDGVSFEAHKVLNRLGSATGRKILTTLVKEMGGPGNVTKAAVAARLKMADPDHVPQANGKTPSATSTTSTGNQVVTPMTLTEMANELASKLTVGELGKDTALADAVCKVADIFEAFAQRKQAKASATSAKQAPKGSTPSRVAAKKRAPIGVKAPAKAAPKRPSVKTPSVKTPV